MDESVAASDSDGTTMAPVSGLANVRSLVLSRVWEQGVLGVSTLYLARELGVIRFAPVALLFVANSMAVTISDFGLGLAILRLPPDGSMSTWSMYRLRLLNTAIAVASVLAGVVVGGSNGQAILWSGLIWALSAEAYVRKSAVIHEGAARLAARAEWVATAAFALAAAFAGQHAPTAIATLGAGFAVKHSIELVLCRNWRAVFSADGERRDLGVLWLAQLASYTTANIDYLTVGLILAKPTFSIYVLSFRLANAIPAQVANVTGRVSLVDFGSSATPEARQRIYDKYVPRLMVAGAIGAVVTIALAPLLPVALGSAWRPAAWVIIVLVLGVPWRMVLGVASSMVLASGLATTSLKWELIRLATFAGAFLLAINAGFRVFTAVVTITVVISAVLYHLRGAKLTGVRPWRALLPAATLTIALAAIAATRVTG